MLSALSASAVTCWHLLPTPPLTAVALHPPPPFPNACACLGLSRKLECANCVLLKLPLRCFLHPWIGGVEAMIASSPIVVFLHLIVALPCAPPPSALLCRNGPRRCSRTLLNGWLLCVFIICTLSSLSFVLYHAIAGLCNLESHLRKSSINPSSADFNPTAIRDVVKPRPDDAAVPPLLQPRHCMGGMILHKLWESEC